MAKTANKKAVKSKIKAKAKATKKKVKAKLKGLIAILGATLLVAGCMDTSPASRATTANYDISIKVCMDEGVKSANVNCPFTFGDGALASADSSGSTENQTATPTMDIKPDIDVRYNDPAKAGGDALTNLISSLTTESAALLKDYIDNKKSGTITVTKTDGTTQTLVCKDGVCNPQ